MVTKWLEWEYCMFVSDTTEKEFKTKGYFKRASLSDGKEISANNEGKKISKNLKFPCAISK